MCGLLCSGWLMAESNVLKLKWIRITRFEVVLKEKGVLVIMFVLCRLRLDGYHFTIRIANFIPALCRHCRRRHSRLS